MAIAIEFVYMLVIDLAFFLALLLLMLPLGIWRQAAFAVMKRNFAGYFSNPTGYVFLCIFVLLTSFAAFWPHEFFTTNLANFDQLNRFLPYIMLIFIPAITMSVWAEERRQGTDELLLTLPAKDFDIVIGKYFAAVLVFTVSLLFSQLSNYGVLLALTGGELDSLLLFSTYLGYWFMGIAMLSVGMVASFLTNNLTVGFIFGAAFNAPLAFFSNSDVILSNSAWIERLFNWSLLQRFEPFGRGLISPSSVVYFLGIAVIGIYLCLILIGRRHWVGGRDGTSMFWHYIGRAAFLVTALIAAVLIVQHSPLNQLRMDISDTKISTLTDATRTILDELSTSTKAEDGKAPAPIKIDAYVSAQVPTEYVQTKYDLVNLLREYDVLGGSRIQVNLHQGIEPFSPEAIMAEKRFGIRPENVLSQSRGAVRQQEVILGVAISCGLQRIVVPFVPYGTPVEYELTRDINTVANSRKPTVGVIETDALPLGGVVYYPGPQNQLQTARQPMLAMINELRKQYNVESISLQTEPTLWIEGEEGAESRRRYDVIVAIQPSKMSPDEMAILINLIQLGQPVAIFEDAFPQPEFFPTINGSLFGRKLPRPTLEAADITKLWDALEIDLDWRTRTVNRETGDEIRVPWLVWQRAQNPYPRDPRFDQPEQLIVRDRTEEAIDRFNKDDTATKGINEVLFPYATYFQPKPNASLEFTDLVTTSTAGKILLSDLLSAPNPQALDGMRQAADSNYVLAARIRGPLADEPVDALAKDSKRSRDKTNVVYVSDVDCLHDVFVGLRDNPIDSETGIRYTFQNTPFFQNIVDSLAGISMYSELRSRQARYSTLQVVEREVENSKQEVYEQTQEFAKELQQAQEEIRVEATREISELQSEVDKLQARLDRNEPIDNVAFNWKKQILEQTKREQAQRMQGKFEELNNARKEKERSIELAAELKIQEIQRKFKLMAVLIPPIPPLLVGLIVFTRRRLLEREGISKARRLK
ncbi:MAG: Gldg family protein [Pirellulaceae bacterium]